MRLPPARFVCRIGRVACAVARVNHCRADVHAGLQVGDRTLAPDAPWDSTLIQALSLGQDWKIALPLIRR
jgi:hypothetical protein